MADNVTLPGTGSVVGTDDVGGVQYQQVKLVDGTLDSSTPIGTNSNPLKATGPDCVSLLSTTITVEGASASMDTSGYGAVVAQISGVWQGNCTFEASNDGTVWDTVLVFSRDNLSLQDIITSGGLFTVRPSGRYLRINVQEINGSMVINALGRAAEGIAAADILSLAMDRQNNTPLNVSLLGTKQDAQGALIPSDAAGPFYATAVGAINSTVIDTQGYPSLTVSAVVGAGTVQVYFSDDQRSWTNIVPAVYGQATGVNMPNGGTVSVSATTPLVGQWPCVGRYAQIRFGSVTTAPCTVVAYLRVHPTPQQIGFNVAGGVTNVSLSASTTLLGDFGLQYRASATGAATISKFTAAATTNAASIKASAGRVIGWHLYNTTASAKYFRFFNKASAPTMGTDSPAFVVVIPANSQAFSQYAGGLAFATGIAIACTGAVADLDTTVTAANDVLGAFFYA